MGENTPDPVHPPPPPLDDWMAQLRQHIAAQRRHASATAGSPVTEPTEGLPIADELEVTLQRAAQLANVGASLPAFDRLSSPRRVLARLTGRLILYLLRLITVDQQQFNELVLRILRTVNDRMREQTASADARLASFDERLAKYDELVLQTLRSVDDRMQEQTAAGDARLASFEERLAKHGAELKGLQDAVTARRGNLSELLDERLAEHDAQLKGLQDAIAVHRASLSELDETIARVRELLLPSGDAAEAGDGSSPSPLSDRKGRLLGAALLALRPEHSGRRPESVIEASAFDEALRGSESEVGERQRSYVAYFEGQQDVLDIGCGRGVFLQLLGAAGVRARGVDNNRDMVLRCREKGLDVECGDALGYLRSLPDESLGGVFCAQVIERLQTPDLLQLLPLVFRKLRRNGVFAVETLNPESLLVHYRLFWMDPTHVRLIHPETLEFLFRSAQFRNVECHLPTPGGESLGIPPLPTTGEQSAEIDRFNAATQALNKLLFGGLDYAVIGVR